MRYRLSSTGGAVLAGGAVALILAACAAVPGSAVDSGIEGTITAGPSCPNAQQVSPCPDVPVAAQVQVLDASGGQVTTFRSDSAGHFKVDLAPGTYTLKVAGSNTMPGVPPATSTVTVTQGKYASVQLTLDTGIR